MELLAVVKFFNCSRCRGMFWRGFGTYISPPRTAPHSLGRHTVHSRSSGGCGRGLCEPPILPTELCVAKRDFVLQELGISKAQYYAHPPRQPNGPLQEALDNFVLAGGTLFSRSLVYRRRCAMHTRAGTRSVSSANSRPEM